MKKWLGIILLLLVTDAVSAQEVSGAVLPDVSAISIAPDYDYYSCNVSPEFIDLVKDSMINEMNLSSYSYSNLTDIYCYTNSISLTFIFKKDEESLVGKQVRASFYISDVYDFDAIFSQRENQVLGWTLKNRYVQYLINDTDEEYYVQISPGWDSNYKSRCDDLRDYYETLKGEKYFNDERYYCSIVIKTKTNKIKDLVDDRVSYINYFSDEIRFNFRGYSEGNYDLERIADRIDCDLSKQNYYYPEFETDCYGIYKDKSRVYFSTSTQIDNGSIHLYVYGIIGGKAKFDVSVWAPNINENEISTWIDSITDEFFPDVDLDLDLEEESTVIEPVDGDRYSSLRATQVVTDFSFNTSPLGDFGKSEYEMETQYRDGNTYVTISKPYIQVYVIDIPESVQSSTTQGLAQASSATSEMITLPYYWDRYFVVTEDRIYSSINLDVNNASTAEEKIKEFVDPFVRTRDWELEMSVTGRWYYPRPLVGMAESGVAREAEISAVAAGTSDLASSAVEIDGGQPVTISASTGVRDPLTDKFPEFEELEEEERPTVLAMIINFFKNLFGN